MVLSTLLAGNVRARHRVILASLTLRIGRCPYTRFSCRRLPVFIIKVHTVSLVDWSSDMLIRKNNMHVSHFWGHTVINTLIQLFCTTSMCISKLHSSLSVAITSEGNDKPYIGRNRDSKNCFLLLQTTCRRVTLYALFSAVNVSSHVLIDFQRNKASFK